MKKIAFSEQYGLQQAVLDRTKPMTRREAYDKPMQYEHRTGWEDGHLILLDGWCRVAKSTYRVGEEVAIAQRYEDCWDIYQQRWEAKNDPSDWHTPDAILGDQVDKKPGWKNKMFVRADLMPHRIRITNIRAERLQDISDGDCIKEGVKVRWKDTSKERYYVGSLITGKLLYSGRGFSRSIYFHSARAAFAALIDRISGRGTWQRNPWVFVYEFELIK